jgi:hypothetical protein
VLLSGALWTKPTGGAGAGVMLAVAGYGVWEAKRTFTTEGTEKKKKRFFPFSFWNLRALRDLCGESGFCPKFRIALITGIASAPLGAMWYVRNLALGHAAVDFPADYWHNFAQRSGQDRLAVAHGAGRRRPDRRSPR